MLSQPAHVGCKKLQAQNHASLSATSFYLEFDNAISGFLAAFLAYCQNPSSNFSSGQKKEKLLDTCNLALKKCKHIMQVDPK